MQRRGPQLPCFPSTAWPSRLVQSPAPHRPAHRPQTEAGVRGSAADAASPLLPRFVQSTMRPRPRRTGWDWGAVYRSSARVKDLYCIHPWILRLSARKAKRLSPPCLVPAASARSSGREAEAERWDVPAAVQPVKATTKHCKR